MKKQIELIKKLREETGAGVMEAQKALHEAAGNEQKAREIIAKRGGIKAAEKSNRQSGASWLESYVHEGRIGVLLEISAETDFVVRNEEFKKLAHELALQIAGMAPTDLDELLGQEYIRDADLTVKDLVAQTVAKLGENIVVKRFVRWGVIKNG